MLCDSNCTYMCEILTFLHQDKGGIMHLYKLYAVSKTKKKIQCKLKNVVWITCMEEKPTQYWAGF